MAASEHVALLICRGWCGERPLWRRRSSSFMLNVQRSSGILAAMLVFPLQRSTMDRSRPLAPLSDSVIGFAGK